VGCPYAVRGFDYDYIGVLWLDDLLWRGGKWTVNFNSIHESGIANLLRRALHERDSSGQNTRELITRLTQAYRILLTRALKGAFLWIPDNETRGYVRHSLGIPGSP
jgi:DUF2075 family protein